MDIVCCNCKLSKPVCEYRKSSKSKTGYKSRCKDCLKEYDSYYRKLPTVKQKKQQSAKKYREVHYKKCKEKVLKRNKDWRDNNKDKFKPNELSRLKGREKYYRNKENIFKYINNRRKNDIEYKLRTYLSTSLRNAIKRDTPLGSKNSILTYLGCSIAEFKLHIEFKFSEGMSWENYGKWHIDHIRPLKTFSLVNESDRHMAYNYTNMQPLWALDNIIKSDKYVFPC